MNGRGRLSVQVERDGIATHDQGDVGLQLKMAAGLTMLCCVGSGLCVSKPYLIQMQVAVYLASEGLKVRCNWVLRAGVGAHGMVDEVKLPYSSSAFWHMSRCQDGEGRAASAHRIASIRCRRPPS